MRPDPWDRGAQWVGLKGGSRSEQKADQGPSVHSEPVSDRASRFVRDSAPSRRGGEMTGIMNLLCDIVRILTQQMRAAECRA